MSNAKMRLIKMKTGAYDHRAPGARSVVRITANDPPFRVSAQKAYQLVTVLRVAKYADIPEPVAQLSRIGT